MNNALIKFYAKMFIGGITYGVGVCAVEKLFNKVYDSIQKKN